MHLIQIDNTEHLISKPPVGIALMKLEINMLVTATGEKLPIKEYIEKYSEHQTGDKYISDCKECKGEGSNICQGMCCDNGYDMRVKGNHPCFYCEGAGRITCKHCNSGQIEYTLGEIKLIEADDIEQFLTGEIVNKMDIEYNTWLLISELETKVTA